MAFVLMDSLLNLQYMKKISIGFLFLFSGIIVKAQESTKVPDKNPNYKKSENKYTKGQEKTLQGMNTTEQKTYKAFDWTENKNEKKQERVAFRRKKQLARINNICHVRGCNNMNRNHIHSNFYRR